MAGMNLNVNLNGVLDIADIANKAKTMQSTLTNQFSKFKIDVMGGAAQPPDDLISKLGNFKLPGELALVDHFFCIRVIIPENSPHFGLHSYI